MKSMKDHLYETIHRNKKPLKQIAEEIDMAASYLTRSAVPDTDESETGSGCRFPLKKLVPLIQSTGDFQVLDHIEHSLGRVAFKIPKAAGDLTDIVRSTMASVKEFGHLMAEIEAGIEDNKLTDDEKEKILKEAFDAMQAIVALMHTVKDHK